MSDKKAATQHVGPTKTYSEQRSMSKMIVRSFTLALPLLGLFVYYIKSYVQLPSWGWTNYAKQISNGSETIEARAWRILTANPVIDGHNDLLICVRYVYGNRIYSSEFQEHFVHGGMVGQVDLPRIDQGQYGGAFWAAYWSCPSDPLNFTDSVYLDRVENTLSQIDTFHRLSDAYPHYFSPTLNAAQAEARFSEGKLISPIAIEGLHQIGNSLSVLRQFFNLGVRYATLTHNCHNIYADTAVLNFPNGTSVGYSSYWGGVSLKGQQLIKEMNRLGMIVDLAHVSPETMRDVLSGEHPTKRREDDKAPASVTSPADEEWRGSLAPPIISHSSAYALCPHPRNVPDSILQLVKSRRSIVMVNFNPGFISCSAPFSHNIPTTDSSHATLKRVVEHIMYIGEQIGYDYVGIGSDFDGIPSGPKGAEDVSKLPAVVEELLLQGVRDEDVAKLLGWNLLRVWREVDAVAARLQKEGMLPAEDHLDDSNNSEAEEVRRELFRLDR